MENAQTTPLHRTTDRASLSAQAFEINLYFPTLIRSVEESLQMALEDAKIKIEPQEITELAYWGIAKASKRKGKLPTTRATYLRKSALVRILVRLSKKNPLNEALLTEIRGMIFTSRGSLTKKNALCYGFRRTDWEATHKASKLLTKPSEDVLEDAKLFLRNKLFLSPDESRFFTFYFWEKYPISCLRSLWDWKKKEIDGTFSRILGKLIHYFANHDLPIVFA